VNLTNVSNVQILSVNLIGVNDGSVTENVSVPMGVLIGDATGNHVVNSNDVKRIKTQLGQPVTTTNFQEDINTNGSIGDSDIALAKSKIGSGIP
jgi:hypothetical protein